MKKVSKGHHSSLNELNITPLLDLVFVLLVIFIITTPQLTNSLEISLPSGKPHPPDPNDRKPKINRIYIAEKGQISLNRAPFSLPGLKETLKGMKAAEPDLSVVVEASDEVDYQNVINVLDIIQQLEITKLGLATASR